MTAALLSLLLAAIPVRPAADTGKLAREVGNGRPAVLHFWATWCGACVEEFPRLHDELHALSKTVGVALVSIDKPSDVARVEEFLRRFKLADLSAIVLDAPDPDPVAKGIGEKNWDGTLPATFVFDASGRLRKSFIGRTSAKALAAAVKKLR